MAPMKTLLLSLAAALCIAGCSDYALPGEVSILFDSEQEL